MKTIFYIVEPGDTLWDISKFFGTTVDEILRINPMPYYGKIYPGQKLRIPIPMPTMPKWHTVQPGDTLFKIAQRHGLDINELIAINSLNNPDTIYPGQIIMLHNM